MSGGAPASPLGAGRDRATHSAPSQESAGPRALWFGLFGAPFFWSAQLIVTYAVTAHACFPEREPLITASAATAQRAAGTIIVVALIGALAALTVSVSNWRATRTETGVTDVSVLDRGDGRVHFMAYSGILLSTLFVGAVVLSALALSLVPACW